MLRLTQQNWPKPFLSIAPDQQVFPKLYYCHYYNIQYEFNSPKQLSEQSFIIVLPLLVWSPYSWRLMDRTSL